MMNALQTEIKNIKVTKSICEKYDIRLVNSSSWAKITLSEEDGSVGIISDYGNWSYLWSHHGCASLKHFLIEIDSWYAWNKLSGKTEFNHDDTVDNLKSILCERVAEGSMEVSKMTELSNELDALDYCYSGDHFCQSVFDSSSVVDHVSDIWDYIREDHDQQFMMFFDRLWKPFMEQLREEIEA